MDLPSKPLSRISINHQVAHDRNPIASHFLSAGVIPADFSSISCWGTIISHAFMVAPGLEKSTIHENPKECQGSPQLYPSRLAIVAQQSEPNKNARCYQILILMTQSLDWLKGTSTGNHCFSPRFSYEI